MLDTLNGLDEAAWAGLAALFTVIIGAIGAAMRGMTKHPIETGQPAPPTDRTEYVLKELRELNRKHDEGTRIVDGRFDQMERMLGAVHTDTQVIRERGRTL